MGDSTSGSTSDYAPLAEIVERGQVWPTMAQKYGVENPVPPWKTSLDGVCDALDKADSAQAPSVTDRRDDEDRLSSTIYADVPYPESQLISLAHSLLDRGVIDEAELRQRLSAVRARLEA
ncbi:thiocyanate hydrolase [Williamsia sp. DF01-3]|uniref:thiocyanate hydrolase n=1 Tax=Williamsia sp. DF01-3 TaxID=2934157 RepID=UPI001FF6C5B3|nr:thiocyanate hydrolase [Williamsia sp. DF01-3]MCK0516190.1 thiocyanate hydrolase [Williamsia sp. DF01-3]